MRQAAEKLYSSDLEDTAGNELITFGRLVAETLRCHNVLRRGASPLCVRISDLN